MHLLFLFFRELLSSDAMKEYNKARIYLDENYKSQEHFTVRTAHVQKKFPLSALCMYKFIIIKQI